MRLFRTLLAVAIAAGTVTKPALADPPRDPEDARRGGLMDG